ncbi:MAG: ABC transporter ATP-binding protein [Rhizobiales bacterium]|nr:ABC transporter ATP-binding protein [Hyphomicrobiales bacterium]
MARLTIEALSKYFGDQAALKNVSMQVEDGEFVAVLGPSGCGKTTMLRLVAGFDAVSEGKIAIGDRIVSGPGTHLPPEERRMGIVFQSYALWPHMDVEENVAYALKVQKVATVERAARVARALETVGLTSFRNRRPASLSGGQRQRVALARCLAMQPEIVLLDEPLANLDVHLRASMEDEFATFHKRTGTTMFYITHDQAEAMALADRIAVMDHGRILQFAPPSQLYREPANETVARFIGAGMILPGKLAGEPANGRVAVDILGHRAVIRCGPDHGAQGPVKICVRAQDLAVDRQASDPLSARLRRLVYQGGHFQADLLLENAENLPLALTLPEPCEVAPGDLLPIVLRDGWVVPQTDVLA